MLVYARFAYMFILMSTLSKYFMRNNFVCSKQIKLLCHYACMRLKLVLYSFITCCVLPFMYFSFGSLRFGALMMMIVITSHWAMDPYGHTYE